MRAACVSSVLCTRVLVCKAQGSERGACEDEAKPGARHALFSRLYKILRCGSHRKITGSRSKICKGSRAAPPRHRYFVAAVASPATPLLLSVSPAHRYSSTRARPSAFAANGSRPPAQSAHVCCLALTTVAMPRPEDEWRSSQRAEKADRKKQAAVGMHLMAEIMEPTCDTATATIPDPTWTPYEIQALGGQNIWQAPSSTTQPPPQELQVEELFHKVEHLAKLARLLQPLNSNDNAEIKERLSATMNELTAASDILLEILTSDSSASYDGYRVIGAAPDGPPASARTAAQLHPPPEPPPAAPPEGAGANNWGGEVAPAA